MYRLLDQYAFLSLMGRELDAISFNHCSLSLPSNDMEYILSSLSCLHTHCVQRICNKNTNSYGLIGCGQTSIKIKHAINSIDMFLFLIILC